MQSSKSNETLCDGFTPKYPCRDHLYAELSKYLWHRSECLPPFLYLYGLSGTGKTTILKDVCTQIGVGSSFVDCIECYTPKILYESIMDNLMGHRLTRDNNYAPAIKCENVSDFRQALTRLPKQNPYVLCFDNVERLRNIDANVLPILIRLRDIAQLNICTVFISTVPLGKMGSVAEISAITIYWPQYKKSEYVTILLARYDCYVAYLRQSVAKNRELTQDEQRERLAIVDSTDVAFLANYLALFLDMTLRTNRDINELMFSSRDSFVRYCEPVLTGIAKPTDTQKLRINMVTIFKTKLLNVYKRIEQESSSNSDATKATASNQIYSKQFDLPHYAKYLLIAAYLASHIDSKSDKRLFMKNHGKQRKRLQTIRANAKVSEKTSTQVGAKSFNIDRLLAIFYAIVDDKVALTVTLLAQISSLVHLKLLCFVSGENNIMDGTARLQCTVSLDFIREVGKKVSFDVCQYLYGFE